MTPFINLRCLKPELCKEYLKEILISTPTEVLVHINKCLSVIFVKKLPGVQKCSSVLLDWQATRLCLFLYKLRFIFFSTIYIFFIGHGQILFFFCFWHCLMVLIYPWQLSRAWVQCLCWVMLIFTHIIFVDNFFRQ